MRICVDIDGVVCELRRDDQQYSELEPMQGAVEAIRDLRRSGHYIILYTARHMKTTQANVGAVIAKQGKITLDWLDNHHVEYDEIYFGKPYADIYIDDLAKRFTSWDDILREIQN
jgi:capsule biosynthesis phosphatase